VTAGLPTQRDSLRVWLRIGLLSFGGPAGQIALMHRELVEERRWIGERRFLNALSFCALLPGPEATQLATYLGWLMHGPLGGIAACTLFVLPGAAVMLALSIIYYEAAGMPSVDGVFFGLKCAVLALVLQALARIGQRALTTGPSLAMAAGAFIALYAFALPFPLLILGAGAIGAVAQNAFLPADAASASQDRAPGLVDELLLADPARPARLAAGAHRAAATCLALWLVPVAILKIGMPGRFADIAWFFSKMAVVTLGGAYAVLAYVAQDAVQHTHWLTAPEMISGLGLAETTPGPLILVLQFVGFLAGARAPGALHGLAGGIAASLLTLWVAFLPSIAFVFLGAPLIERIAENRALRSALAAITAAVVGVIANLALWFGLHVLFARVVHLQAGPAHFDWPDGASIDPAARIFAVLAWLCLTRFRWPVPVVLCLSAFGGMALHLAMK
jgi:chromate transporter